jgi:hypothetical protein
VIGFLKGVFAKMEKFAEYFVRKGRYIEEVMRQKRYEVVRHYPVRTEGNRYVPREDVEETLARMLEEGDTYIDIEEVMDFFSNRGRPQVIEYHVYLANLERQLAAL